MRTATARPRRGTPLMPTHAIIRHHASHSRLMCRCGAEAAGAASQDEERRALAAHIIENERQAR